MREPIFPAWFPDHRLQCFLSAAWKIPSARSHRGVKCSVTQTPLTCEDTHVHTQIHHTLFMQKVWCERVDGEIVLFGKVETVRWCHAIVVQEYTLFLLLIHYSVQAQWTYFHLRGQRIGGWCRILVGAIFGAKVNIPPPAPSRDSPPTQCTGGLQMPSNAECINPPVALHVCIGFGHWHIQPSDFWLHKWRNQLCWRISLIIEDSQGNKRES